MSYARMASDSDVFVYLDASGLRCLWCSLTDGRWSDHDDTASMLAHLDTHEAAGDAVPPDCRAALIEDQDENDRELARW